MLHNELSSKKRSTLLVLQPSVKERKMQSLHFLLCMGLTPFSLHSTPQRIQEEESNKGSGEES